jgi:DCN1-like protein 1/2
LTNTEARIITNLVYTLTNIFPDAPENNPDGIGIEGVMNFLGDIQVQLDEVACFGIAELVKSPTMGEFTREGFVEGWRLVKCVEDLPMSHCWADT